MVQTISLAIARGYEISVSDSPYLHNYLSDKNYRLK